MVLFTVTEGEDKPLKYPKMFQNSRYAVLTKTDLLPYVPFDVAGARANALRVNPSLEFFELSASSGEGMAAWFGFLRSIVRQGAGV